MNQMTTGASNDFERATQMARDMVTRYGMSDVLGPMVYAENEGEVFLGRSITKTTNMSEETMSKVDARFAASSDDQYALARAADRGKPRQGRSDGPGLAGIRDDRRRADRKISPRAAAAAAEIDTVKHAAQRRQAGRWNRGRSTTCLSSGRV